MTILPVINPSPVEPGYTLRLANSVDPDRYQLASEEANRSGSALFVI